MPAERGTTTFRARIAAVAAALAWLALASPAPAAAKASFAELLANLKSPNAGTRQEAAIELGKSRRREAVPPLSAMLRDPEPKVRMAAVRALRELRDLSATSGLCTSVQDGDAGIREEAIGALVELYAERERTSPVERFLDLFSDEFDRASVPLYTTVDPQVVSALAGALRDEDKSIRREAALALGILDGRAAVRDLVAALQDPDAGVRGAAVTAIGKVGTAAEGKALIPLIADESAEVRHRALQALGVLRVREAGPALRELYDANRTRELSTRVLASLSRIADPSQGDLFRELLQDADTEKKRLAIEGLARIADTSLLPAFKKDYQREGNEQLKLAYSFGLARLGDRAFIDSIVLALPSRTLGTQARRYLLEMGKDILPELYPYLNDPEAEIRATLCDIVAQIGDADAVARLAPLVSDPNAKVADRANRAVELLRRSNPPPR